MSTSPDFLATHQQEVLVASVEVTAFRQAIEFGKRLLGRAALIVCLGMSTGAAIGAAETVLEPHPSAAAADDNNYPDGNKVCVAAGPPQGQTSGSGDDWCPGYQWGDFIKDAKGNIIGNVQNSGRGYGYRNCTDWAAFRIGELLQVSLPHDLGNANTWDDNAASHDYVLTNTPEEGDIAESDAGSYGHVGVVEAINKDADGNITSIRVSQYNASGDGTYSHPEYTPDSNGVYWRNSQHTAKWDHFIDVNGVGKGINGRTLADGARVSSTLTKPQAVTFNRALNVFIRGGDGQIYTQYWDGSAWSGYASIGGNMASDPAVVVNGAALNVFARGVDGQVYTKYFDGSSWTGWASLGGTTMRSNLSVTRYGSEVDVFALGTDNHPYKDSWDSAGGWTTLGNYMDSAPSAVQHGGELDVVMRGGDNAIYKNAWNGSSWSGFGTLGGGLAGDPEVLQYGSELDIWSNTAYNTIYKRTWNGAGWGEWTAMGSGLAGAPYALQYGNDMEVYARGTNGQIYTRYWSASGQFWSGWASLGGNIAGDPTAIQYGGELDVFAIGKDGKTYKDTFNFASGWGGFTTLPG